MVFDLDDTLIGSGRIWEESWRALCAEAGRGWSHADAAACNGSGQWSRRLAGWCGIEVAEVEQSCSDYMIAALAASRIELLEGAIELITAVAGQVPVGLASAGPRRFVDAAVTTFGLTSYLDHIVYADEVAAGKPAPDIYLRSAQTLGLPPNQCLAVEDSGNGIRAAHAAGMQILAIPNPAHRPSVEVLGAATWQAADAATASKILVDLIDRTLEPTGNR